MSFNLPWYTNKQRRCFVYIDDDIRIGDPLTTAAPTQEATTVEPGTHRCIYRNYLKYNLMIILLKEQTCINLSEKIPYMRRNDSRCLHGDYLEDSYPTRMDAESICDLMQHQFRNCTTIYDRACDGDTYKICKQGAKIATSPEGSCIYSNIGYINWKLFH